MGATAYVVGNMYTHLECLMGNKFGYTPWVYVVDNMMVRCGEHGDTLWVTIVYVVGTISCVLYVVVNIRCGHMLPTTYTVVPHNVYTLWVYVVGNNMFL